VYLECLNGRPHRNAGNPFFDGPLRQQRRGPGERDVGGGYRISGLRNRHRQFARKPDKTMIVRWRRLDGKFRFTFIKRAAEGLLGAPRADLIEKTPWDVKPETAERKSMEEQYKDIFELTKGHRY